MTYYLRPLAVAAALLSFACGPPHTHDGEHAPHGPHGAHDDADEDEGHGHGHGDGALAVTHWTERTELFVEFPALTVGEESAFAAHLTRVSDFAPVGEGAVTVLLSGGGAPDESFVVQSPTVPGIFRPVAVPRHPGSRQLTLQLASADLNDTHDLGEVTVYADADAAAHAAPEDEPEDPSEITFLKEQQWPIGFTMAQATERTLRPAMAVSGTVRASANGEAMISAPTAGRLVSPEGAFPRLGQRVERGEVLTRLAPLPGGNPGVASLQLAVARGQLAVEHGQRERQRLEALGGEGSVPERRVTEARHREAESEAELTAARRRLGQHGRAQRVSSSGGGITVRAPISGTLVAVHVAPGEFVEASRTLFHVVDTEHLWLEVKVPEANIGRIEQPSGAWFDIAGFERHFEVPLEQLVSAGDIVDPRTRTISVIFDIDNPEGRLRAGMFADVHLLTGPTIQAVSIPFAAVIEDGGQQVVFVQAGGETFLRRPVRLGIRDGDNVQITQGVERDEYVAVHGAFMVKLAASATEAPAHGHAH